MIDAGELDPTEVETPNWSLSIALTVVIVFALVVGVLALVDGPPSDASRRAEVAAASVLGTSVVRPTDGPSTSVAPGSTEAPTTAAPTTGAPTTAAPTTPPPTEPPPTEPPATAPPATQPPATVPPTVAPAPEVWLAVTANDGGFAADFPSQPSVTVPMVRGPGGTVGRTEYNVDGPGGCRISVTSMPADRGAQSAEAFLAAVADQARRDVEGTLLLGAPRTISGAPSRPFTIVVPGGQIRAEVVYAKGRLFTVSMFKPVGGATGPAADATFDRMLASFRLT